MKRTLITRPLALAVVLASVPAVAANEEVGEADAPEEIVVTAARREMKISEIGASVSAIGAAAIEAGQYAFALDALQTLPGVSVSQNSSFGGVATVRLRGAAADHTMILIDGVQMNDASAPGGGFDFASLDPFDLERVEVLKGPQSVLYGSDAMGGVVHFITKSGADGFGLNGFVEGGSFNTVRSGATVRGGDKDLHYRLSAGYTRTDGISSADAADGNTERDGFRNLTLSGRLVAAVSDAVGVELMARYGDNRNEYDNFWPADADEVSEGHEAALGARLLFDLGETFENTLSVDYSEIERTSFTDGFEGFGSKGERINLDWLGVTELSDLVTLTTGINHEETKVRGQSDDSQTITGVFADLGLSTDTLNLTGGVRYDDHDSFGSATTGRVTASWSVTDSTSLFGSWGEGFKAPSIFQLTYICTFCGLTAPSSDLAPEETNAVDLGVQQQLLDGDVTLSATWFNQKSSGLITFDFFQGYVNLAKSRSRGVEVALDATLSDGLTLNANYSRVSAVDRDSDTALIRQPKNQAAASLAWDATAALSLRSDVTYFGEMTDFGGAVVPDWFRVDLKADFEISESISLYGRIENLFDKQYQQLIGYGTPGLSGYIGIRAKY